MVALKALLSLFFVLASASAAPRFSQRKQLIPPDIDSSIVGRAAPEHLQERQFNPRNIHRDGVSPVGRGVTTGKDSRRALRRQAPQGVPGPFGPNPATASQPAGTGTAAPFPQATPGPASAPPFDPAPAPPFDPAPAPPFDPAPDPASVPAPPPGFDPDTSSTPDGFATPTVPAAPVSTTIDSQPRNGQGTFYSTGKGACGWNNTDTDMIAALSHSLYDLFTVGTDNNDNSLCNKSITAHAGANSVDVTVADRCTGCQFNDLDFSPAAFSKLADKSKGRIDITWTFNDP